MLPVVTGNQSHVAEGKGVAGTPSALVLVRRAVGGHVVDEDSNSAFFYRSQDDKKLKQTIRETWNEVGSSVRHTTALFRKRLLPALLELQERLPHGEWERFLRSVGMN